MIKKVIVIFFIFLLFKIFIGEINLNISVYYNHRLFDVTLNRKLISVCVEEYRKNTIIPLIVNNDYSAFHCFHNDNEGMNMHVLNKGDEIYITINSYECISSITGGKTSCVPYKNQKKKEVNDTNYSLLIRKAGGKEKMFYDGKFVNNITNYFYEKGVYSVSIISRYKNVVSNVSFSIKIVDSNRIVNFR